MERIEFGFLSTKGKNLYSLASAASQCTATLDAPSSRFFPSISSLPTTPASIHRFSPMLQPWGYLSDSCFPCLRTSFHQWSDLSMSFLTVLKAASPQSCSKCLVSGGSIRLLTVSLHGLSWAQALRGRKSALHCSSPMATNPVLSSHTEGLRPQHVNFRENTCSPQSPFPNPS